MWWLILILVAQALLAIVSLGDKFLLTGSIGRPTTYASAVGMAGFSVILATPFLGLPWSGWQVSYLAFSSGILFVLAILPFYEGIRRFETSRIVPATGAMIPIFTLLFSWVMFRNGESHIFDARSLTAFALLILGGLWISREPGKKIGKGSLLFGFAAAPIFALSTVIMKAAYMGQPLWSGFFWYALGLGFCGFAIMALDRSVVTDFRSIMGNKDKSGGNRSAKIYFPLIQIAGSIASVLQSVANYLVPAGQVAFLNALQGTQYVFLFILSSLITKIHPNSNIRENISGNILANKILAISAILAGIILLVYGGYN